MVTILLHRTFVWSSFWARTNIPDTVPGEFSPHLIPKVSIYSQMGGTGKIYFSISRHQPVGNPFLLNFRAIQEKLDLLVAKCSRFKLDIEYSKGRVVLTFKDNDTTASAFYNAALEMANSIWEVFGLEKYLLKIFTYHAEEKVVEDDGTMIGLGEWLKKNHPRLN